MITVFKLFDHISYYIYIYNKKKKNLCRKYFIYILYIIKKKKICAENIIIKKII